MFFLVQGPKQNTPNQRKSTHMFFSGKICFFKIVCFKCIFHHGSVHGCCGCLSGTCSPNDVRELPAPKSRSSIYTVTNISSCDPVVRVGCLILYCIKLYLLIFLSYHIIYPNGNEWPFVHGSVLLSVKEIIGCLPNTLQFLCSGKWCFWKLHQMSTVIFKDTFWVKAMWGTMPDLRDLRGNPSEILMKADI